MKIQGVPFTVIDWAGLASVEHPGQSGTSHWKTAESGNLRVRMVEYSPGFEADHWCGRGHVLLVAAGSLRVELKDGRKFDLPAGTGFKTSDDQANPHWVASDIGARVFIVD